MESNGPLPEATLRTIDELKRAFELVEVSSPGVSDQLINRIFVHLQSRWEQSRRGRAAGGRGGVYVHAQSTDREKINHN